MDHFGEQTAVPLAFHHRPNAKRSSLRNSSILHAAHPLNQKHRDESVCTYSKYVFTNQTKMLLHQYCQKQPKYTAHSQSVYPADWSILDSSRTLYCDRGKALVQDGALWVETFFWLPWCKSPQNDIQNLNAKMITLNNSDKTWITNSQIWNKFRVGVSMKSK